MNEKNMELKNGKNLKERKLIGLFILIVFAVVVGIIYIASMATPRRVFESSFHTIFDNLNQANKKDIKTISGNVNVNATIDSKDENKIFDLINQLDVTLDYGIDYESKNMQINFDSSYKEKGLIRANIVAQEENAYVYLEKIFDKYIQIPMEGFDKAFNNQKLLNDYQTILSEVEKAMNLSLKDEYFSSEKTTLTINKKETEVTKNILNLNAENQNTFFKDLARHLNNDTFIKSVANITEVEENEIKENLENVITKGVEAKEDIMISIFTTGMMKSIVGFEMKDQTDTILVVKDTKNHYSYMVDGENKFDGAVELEKKNANYSVVIKLNYQDVNATIRLKFSNTYNKNLEDINTSNFVSYENLTREDQETITKNLMNNGGIKELLKDFQEIWLSHKNSSLYD